MSVTTMKLIRLVAVVSVMCWMSTAAFAGPKVPVTATIADTCPNCPTDADGADPTLPGGRSYSVKSDGAAYTPSQVLSNILTNNSVYTLDTSGTLVNGLVGPSTRTAAMHFYSPVECKPGQTGCTWPNNKLPVCWGGNYDQDQAVNWAIFAPMSFLNMSTTGSYQGMARLNFNVRSAACDREMNRFRLEWGAVCIKRSTSNIWTVTSGTCVATQTNYGEAHMQAYGGKKGETVDYGDWRMPFKLTLTK